MGEKEEEKKAIIHKDNSLNRLDLSFLTHIDLKEYKQCNLLAYWINDFANYHDNERNFDTTKIKTFKRGNIVKVNLGYNIGHELGGLHYCIVLDRFDNPKNGTLNVIPLTSKKENKIYPKSCLNIGNELYNILSVNIKKENEKLDKILQEVNKIEQVPVELQQAVVTQMRYMDKLALEISKMKHDSIALITQITTISKQRLFNDNTLKNVHLSKETLSLIDDKIRFYFTNIKKENC